MPGYLLPRWHYRSKSGGSKGGKLKRGGLFYGPLAWKPLTVQERYPNLFGSDSESDSESSALFK